MINDIKEERNLRLFEMRNDGGHALDRLRNKLNKNYHGEDLDRISNVLNFAIDLDYHHEGLTKKAYLAHPFRVAMLMFDHFKEIEVQTIILALLHNVLEVSPKSGDMVKSIVGDELFLDLECLTIDRQKQTQDAYLIKYYKGILEKPKYVRAVKTFDKLDNIFTLCINPNDLDRKRYIAEIERFIFPIAASFDKKIIFLFEAIIKDNHKIGHIGL